MSAAAEAAMGAAAGPAAAGPAAARPAAAGDGRLRVQPAGHAYADAVLADLLRIRRTAAGRAVFRRLQATGATVTVEKPLPPTAPPNAWVRPRDPAGARGEILVTYDPADWPSPCRPGSPPSDAMLFGRLEDAAALAEGGAIACAPRAEASPALAAYLRERAAP